VFNSKGKVGLIQADIKLKLTKPDEPEIGDVYYDARLAKAYVYMFGVWKDINPELQPVNSNLPIVWSKDGKSIHIIGFTWWFEHAIDIKLWLGDNNGIYNKGSSSIIFDNPAAATYFKLKWG